MINMFHEDVTANHEIKPAERDFSLDEEEDCETFACPFGISTAEWNKLKPLRRRQLESLWNSIRLVEDLISAEVQHGAADRKNVKLPSLYDRKSMSRSSSREHL
uniref:Uncharacterized protein n=1 Tax=Guillardia theta TaxID=55529 RepID=A0A7S4KY84_GUITH|mmetsp:Transcript_33267/g.105063  ORF Transcript_33267/g.105063 Transcript_33267/m.105063 type:complete len:104 (+) Transcript_33267:69-380(+)